MNIDKIKDINFKARYLGEVTIKKRGLFRYKPYKASLVEFDKKDANDLAALQTLIKNWKGYIKYLLKSYEPSERTIGLTVQKRNFEKINPKKMLGILQYYEQKKSILLARFQTAPNAEYSENNYKRKYKETGSRLIERVLPPQNNKSVSLLSSDEAIPFYEKQGFKHLKGTSNFMYFGEEPI